MSGSKVLGQDLNSRPSFWITSLVRVAWIDLCRDSICTAALWCVDRIQQWGSLACYGKEENCRKVCVCVCQVSSGFSKQGLMSIVKNTVFVGILEFRCNFRRCRRRKRLIVWYVLAIQHFFPFIWVPAWEVPSYLTWNMMKICDI